jgi:hypothetical protein
MRYNVKYSIIPDTYDVEYNKVIYNYQRKTKTKFVESQSSKFNLSQQISFSESNKSIGELTEELVKDKLESMFNDAKRREIFIAVNNAIAAQTPTPKYRVSSSYTTNGGTDEGIWELCEPIVQEGTNGALEVSRGHVVVEGDIYDVEDVADNDQDKGRIVQQDGNKKYELVEVPVHVVDISHEWGEGPNGFTSRIAAVSLNGDDVSKSTLESMFEFVPDNLNGDNGAYMKIKPEFDRFPATGTAFTFDGKTFDNEALWTRDH